MGTRSGLISFCCVILAITLAGTWLFPSRPSTVIIVEPIDPSVFKHIVFKGFNKREETLMRDALTPKFTGKCTAAFDRAGLRSPWQVAWESGIVIQYSRDLYVKEARDLGLVYTETRDGYQSEFSTCRAQAGTVPHVLYDTVLTTDGRIHIFVHDSAFVGESIFLGTFSLSDVFSHEMIHAGGQPPTPGLLGSLTHDLSGFEPYDDIIESCR
jgi:hypothetical protein